jgi:hypothetical protein
MVARTLDQFVQACRDQLCILGLPINDGWQPTRADIQVFYTRGFTVNDVVKAYRPRVTIYENFVNGGSSLHRLPAHASSVLASVLSRVLDQLFC